MGTSFCLVDSVSSVILDNSSTFTKDTFSNSLTEVSTFSGIDKSRIKISLSIERCSLVTVGVSEPVETIKISALSISCVRFSIEEFLIDVCSFTKEIAFSSVLLIKQTALFLVYSAKFLQVCFPIFPNPNTKIFFEL